MASVNKIRSRPTTAGTNVGAVEETGSTRKRIQEVLGQARATLRQSQQFRPKIDKKNNNLSSRLTFQQQKQDDYWSSENAGEVIIEETVNPLYEGSRPATKSAGRNKSFFDQDDDFGLPFRDAQKRTFGPKRLGSTRQQQKEEFGRRRNDDNSSDSSSITMSTADLKITSDDDSDDKSTVVAVGGRETAASIAARSKMSKSSKEVRILEPPHSIAQMGGISASEVVSAALTSVPAPLMLTPLTGRNMEEDGEKGSDDEDEEGRPLSVPKHSTEVSVRADDLGFSRATVKKSRDDPHWFEKALLVRGEPISEAAYKAFKKAHEIQEDIKKKGESVVTLAPPPKILPQVESLASGIIVKDNLPKEPEYTADWISDLDMASYMSEHDALSSIQDEVISSVPELVSELDERLTTIPDDDQEDEDKTIVNEANTESLIRTSTELEASGVLGEIMSNLKNVLEISDKPASQDFSRMSAEERNFAKEYDEAMKDKDEPLGSIFHTVYADVDASKNDTEDIISKSLGLSDKEEEYDNDNDNDEDVEEGQYENTFMSTSSSASEKTLPTKSSPTGTFSASRKQSSISRKSLTHTPAQTKLSSSSTGPKTKVSSSRVEKEERMRRLSKEKVPAEVKVESRRTRSRINSNSDATNNNNSSSLSQQKSVTVTSSSTKRSQSRLDTTKQKSEPKPRSKLPSSRINPPPQIPPMQEPLTPPTNRYQKNIQNILEKEVYQEELKRQRKKRLKEERNQERLQIIAQEALERNRTAQWKDPATTEVLLPELFKYKSISGLQAAKAKKSQHYRSQPGLNYSAPYFQLNGSVQDEDGAAQLLAKAQVESLDIPDLVREVLASNERMYRMTVEASRKVNKIYKDKIDKVLNK